jgi:hypothetical protein
MKFRQAAHRATRPSRRATPGSKSPAPA